MRSGHGSISEELLACPQSQLSPFSRRLAFKTVNSKTADELRTMTDLGPSLISTLRVRERGNQL
jgi:hypothetical protein